MSALTKLSAAELVELVQLLRQLDRFLRVHGLVDNHLGRNVGDWLWMTDERIEKHTPSTEEPT